MMQRINRRTFMGRAIAAATMVAGAGAAAQESSRRRKFTMDLVCGAIGVRANLHEAIALAARHGYESVAPAANELARMEPIEIERIQEKLNEYGLVWGAAGLPVDFRRDEETFQQGLRALPASADALKEAGVRRVTTWIRPCHNELTYLANFRLHVRRLRAVADILGERNQRFGLEYVGPQTSWKAQRFPFIHTLVEARELIAEIDRPNVGLVLDSWHWYTAGETADDLRSLTNDDVVACDLNDAPAGIAVDEQIDNRRELPAATGVIDVKAFLEALVAIGYDGPVRAEPFNERLRQMEDEQAVAATAAALKKAFALVESA